jgi:hypothetical protein
MNDLPPLLKSAAAPIPDAPLHPTFLGALRGIWLLTWRSNLTWGRLPGSLLTILVLPVLVYITTVSMESWSNRFTLLGSPSMRANELAGRLARAGVALKPEQRRELNHIYQEEFSRAESAFRSAGPGETSVNRQKEAIQDCYARVQDRCRNALDAGQFAEYIKFEKRALALAESGVRERRWTRTEPFYHWLIDFYFFVILPLNCVRACGGLIRDEVQADTLGFLTTRPLTRARLLLVKFISQTAWVQMLMLLETLLLFAVGALRQIPNLGALLPLFLAAQFLAVLAWSALGIFLGQATKRYMAAALLYGLVIEVGIGRIPTNINNLSLTRHFKALLGHNSALEAIYDWSIRSVPYCIGPLLLACGIFLALATLLFTFREYHHTAEMQK